MAKGSSVFVQDENRAGCMIGFGTFESVCAVVAKTAGFVGTGRFLIVSEDDRNSGGCNHLRDTSRGSRPRVPWSALLLFNVEECLHCFPSVFLLLQFPWVDLQHIQVAFWKTQSNQRLPDYQPRIQFWQLSKRTLSLFCNVAKLQLLQLRVQVCFIGATLHFTIRKQVSVTSE